MCIHLSPSFKLSPNYTSSHGTLIFSIYSHKWSTESSFRILYIRDGQLAASASHFWPSCHFDSFKMLWLLYQKLRKWKWLEKLFCIHLNSIFNNVYFIKSMNIACGIYNEEKIFFILYFDGILILINLLWGSLVDSWY